VGDDAEDSFSKTSFSSDRTCLAIGTWNGNYFKMLENNGNNYGAFGDTIVGEGGDFGSSVDMSADGTALVVGSDEGKVCLHDTFSSSPDINARNYNTCLRSNNYCNHVLPLR